MKTLNTICQIIATTTVAAFTLSLHFSTKLYSLSPSLLIIIIGITVLALMGIAFATIFEDDKKK